MRHVAALIFIAILALPGAAFADEQRTPDTRSADHSSYVVDQDDTAMSGAAGVAADASLFREILAKWLGIIFGQDRPVGSDRDQ